MNQRHDTKGSASMPLHAVSLHPSTEETHSPVLLKSETEQLDAHELIKS
jgi:hypothetical protein